MQQPTRPPFALFGVFVLLFALVGASFARPLLALVDPNTSAETSSGDGSLLFIENVGQFPAGARFQVWGGAESLWLAEDALWLTVAAPEPPRALGDAALPASSAETAVRQSVALRLSFPGANPHPQIEPFGRQDVTFSYFQGADSAQWRSNVPVWRGVRYVDLFPGLDLEVSAIGGAVHWGLVANGRATPDNRPVILLIEGADDLALISGPNGSMLQLSTASGEQLLPLPNAPVALKVNGTTAEGRVVTLTAPALSPRTVAASKGSLAPSELPAGLLYSTFLGSSGNDWAAGIAAGADGSAYVTGYTYNADFPRIPGSFEQGRGIFVAKFAPTGTALVYVAIVGSATAYGIAVDSQGQAYVTGTTGSDSFPTTSGAFDPTYNDAGCASYCGDAFVTKLNAAGSSLIYSTYLGGENCSYLPAESGLAIAADDEGSAYVTGKTYCDTFPTTSGAYDRYNSALPDAFVTKLNPNGSRLVYSTYMGGGTSQYGNGIAVDAAHNAYVAGFTRDGSDFTVPIGGHAGSSGSREILVAKLNADGSERLYGVSFGGAWDDTANGIAIDPQGNAYITGITPSSDFPTTPGAFDITYNGPNSCDGSGNPECGDGFVAKLNPTGTTLLYSTFLGGTDWDSGAGIAADPGGHAYVTGQWAATGDTSSGFLAVLKPDGSDLDDFRALGGSGIDKGAAVALTGEQNAVSVFVTGRTASWNFPTTRRAFDQGYNGYDDAFAMRWFFGDGPSPLPLPTPRSTPATLLFPYRDGTLHPLPQGASTNITIGRGMAQEWSTDLDGDIACNRYVMALYSIYTNYSNPFCFQADLLTEHTGVAALIYSGQQCPPSGEFLMTFEGSGVDPATQLGDRLILRVTCLSGSSNCAFRIGSDTDAHVEIPALVSSTPTPTASPTLSPTPTATTTTTPRHMYLPLVIRS